MTYTEIKMRAKKSLQGKFFVVSLINFLYNICNAIFIGIITISLSGALLGVIYKAASHLLDIDFEKELDKTTRTIIESAYGKEFLSEIGTVFLNICKACADMIPVLLTIVFIGIILWAIVGSIFTAGIHNCYYKVACGEDVRVRDMVSNARLWPKFLGMVLLKYGAFYIVYIGVCMLGAMFISFLGALVVFGALILGGIVLIEFMMAPIILTDNNDKGVIQCMKEASGLIKSIRANMIGFCLSFIGWGLCVCAISTVFAYIIPIFGTVALSMLQTYFWVSYVHYYLYLTGQDVDVQTASTNYYNYQATQDSSLNNNGTNQFGNGTSQFGNMTNNQANNMNYQSNNIDDDLVAKAEKLSNMDLEDSLELEDELELELEKDTLELELENDFIDLE